VYTHIILVYYYKCMSMPFDFCTFLFPLTALCSVLQTLHLGTPKVGSLMVCISHVYLFSPPMSHYSLPLLSLPFHSTPNPHGGSRFQPTPPPLARTCFPLPLLRYSPVFMLLYMCPHTTTCVSSCSLYSLQQPASPTVPGGVW